MMKKCFYLLIGAICILSLFSCSKDDPDVQSQDYESLIVGKWEEYLCRVYEYDALIDVDESNGMYFTFDESGTGLFEYPANSRSWAFTWNIKGDQLYMTDYGTYLYTISTLTENSLLLILDDDDEESGLREEYYLKRVK